MTQQRIIGIIPARFGSTRFPGKPLVPILGKTLIQRTYESGLKCDLLDSLLVATDSQEIYHHVQSFGGKAIMTPDCATGTDRLASVMQDENIQGDIIINIQGDWPLLDPAVVTAVANVLLEDATIPMATAIVKIQHGDDLSSPSLVKCVVDQKGYALYFSRAVIPANAQSGNLQKINYFKHLGIYGYQREFLLKYANLPTTPLQEAEDLEQLKALEWGYRIKTVEVEHFSIGVDTPEDVKKVEQILCKQNTSL